MNNNDTSAEQLAGLWHKILQNPQTHICTDKLKFASVLDVNILRVISENETIIIRDIGNILSVGASTLSSAIKRLENKGLLKRIIFKGDLRSYAVQLTEEGKEVLRCHHNRELELMRTMLDKLHSEEEQKQFIYLLDKITK